MRRISLPSILLLTTLITMEPPKPVIPFTWLLFFLLPLCFILLFFLTDYWKIFPKHLATIRLILLGCIGLFFVIFPMILMMLWVHDKPMFRADSLTQTEGALVFLSQGKNPYSEDFRQIGIGEGIYRPLLGSASDDIPGPIALHYVYPPLYLGLSYPFFILSNTLFGFYDQTIVLLITAVVLFFSLIIVLPEKWRELAMTLIFFNPFFLQALSDGMNDIVPLTALTVAILLLTKKRWNLAAAILGAAVAIKHSFLIGVPFFLLYAFVNARGETRNLFFLRAYTPLFAFIAVVLTSFLPFVLWSPKDLFDDLIGYPMGLLSTSHPISGYGFSQLFPVFGIARRADAIPLWIFQIVIVLPVAVVLFKKLFRHPTLSCACEYSAIILLLSTLFLRYMHFNYFVPIITLFFLAFFLQKEDKTEP